MIPDFLRYNTLKEIRSENIDNDVYTVGGGKDENVLENVLLST